MRWAAKTLKMVWDSVSFQRLVWQKQADWKCPCNLPHPVRTLSTPPGGAATSPSNRLLWLGDLGSNIWLQASRSVV